jgi:hypothetical protein
MLTKKVLLASQALHQNLLRAKRLLLGIPLFFSLGKWKEHL